VLAQVLTTTAVTKCSKFRKPKSRVALKITALRSFTMSAKAFLLSPLLNLQQLEKQVTFSTSSLQFKRSRSI
jgi:hypothetical protein